MTWGGIQDLNITRFQQDDPAISYMGPWTTVNTWSAFGGSYVSGTYPGCSINVEFDGNYIAWYGTKRPDYGPAGRTVVQVFLDGAELQTWEYECILYSPYPKYKQKLFDSGYLRSGHHTLTIMHWANYGSGFSADAFDVLGTLTDAEPAPHRIWYYQEKDPRLTFMGTWTASSTPSATGEYSHYSADTPGAAVLASFMGTRVDMVGRTAPWYGKGFVSLDGGPEQEVDFYSETPGGAHVFQAQGLDDGPHQLMLRRSGDKNPLSTGTSISLDYLIMNAYLVDATRPDRYQQDDSDFKYVGPWTTGTTWSASGGSFASVDAPGSSVNVEFNGTYLEWFARTTPWYGKAQAVLDGDTANPVTVDLYSPATGWKKRVYSTGLLSDGPHTLSIYWTGQKNTASAGTAISTDTFDMMGAPSAADPADPMEWRYQQTDSRIVYCGEWTTGTTWSASGGSYASTSQAGAMAVATFTGTSVTAVLRTTPWYGLVKFTLDPGTVAEDSQTIDLYSPTVGWKVTSLYSKTGLADTEHTLVVENVSDDGKAIGLDALDITGYLGEGQQLSRIDDNDSSYCAYDPAWPRWDASGYWAAYQDTYAFTDQTTNKVTVTFHGRYLSWISRTANTQGMAKVTLDGNTAEAQTIDLYSPTTRWKKSVYSTGFLTDDWHTVVIECLGTKNPASWWYSIGVDAFDIMETAP